MTIDKFLKQVADLFDVEQSRCEKEKKCLREALKKLKKREDTLETKVDRERSDKKRSKLNDELKVIIAQRAKGEKILKELEKE